MTTSTSTSKHRSTAGAAALLLALTGAAASAAPASAAPGFQFSTRIAGDDRYATAVEASKLLYPNDGTTTDVVIVNGNAVVDGLTASYLSGLRAAPILYTQTDSLPAVSAAEVDRLGAETIWIVGGEAVVSAGLAQSWKDAGYTVERLAGADRYATAAAVAQVEQAFAPEEVYITSGTAIMDALAVGPLAWARNHPILLTQTDRVPAATSAALEALGTPARTVVGGTDRISDATYSALGATERIAGASRHETATLVAEEAIADEFFDPNSIALVSGSDSAAVDALSASPVAGATGTPLLFTAADGSLGDVTQAYLSGNAARFTGSGWVFGGTAVVPEATVEAARAAAQ